MKLANTLALCLTATMLWNCNESTKPESTSMDKGLPATVDAAARYTARTAGYQISSEAASGQPDGFKFPKEAVDALKEAGICENFIYLIQELGTDSTGGPRFTKAVQCLSEEVENAGAASSSEMLLSFVDKCLCDGGGNLFAPLFAIQGYEAPKFTGYKAPSVPGYKAPAVPGYKAPSLGNGYSAPKL